MSENTERAYWFGKQAVIYGLAYTAREPFRALSITYIMANPRLRGVVVKAGIHMGKQALVDLAFYSRLIVTDIVLPAARPIGRVGLSAARAIPVLEAAPLIGVGALVLLIAGPALQYEAIEETLNTTGGVLTPHMLEGGFQF
jgi:hypothetical protein